MTHLETVQSIIIALSIAMSLYFVVYVIKLFINRN